MTCLRRDTAQEAGKLTARISWYVIDERSPSARSFERKSDAGIAAQASSRNVVDRRSRRPVSEGIRPMPLCRLLAYLGYEMGTPIVGRAEAVNGPAMRRLVEARKQPASGKPRVEASQPAAQPAAKTDEGTKDMPAKDELKDNENPK